MEKIKLICITIILINCLNIQCLLAQPNWHEQFLPDIGNRHLNYLTFIDAMTGYACTGVGQQGYDNYVLKTTDGGENWKIILTMYKEFSKVEFLNNNTGFLTGGFNTGPIILKTTNAGINWFNLSQPTGNLYINDISIVDQNRIWLASYGDILNSTDGGNTWNFQYHAYLLNRIYMFNQYLGFGGSNMYTFRTTNGGANWNPITSFYSDIFFVDSLTGWKGDYIAKSTNGGLNWINEILPNVGSYGGVVSLSVISRDIIWGSGDIYGYGNNVFRGILYFTSNGGDNWTYQIPDTSFGIENYFFIKFINNNTGWAYGSNKGIHTTNGGGFITGIQPSQNNIPDKFSLLQNYPNPFNPSTKISYDLPVSGFVNLVVYDVLGREVITLVNEKQNAGSYNVNWNASNNPSGIYFYKLTVRQSGSLTGDFTQTRKMSLIK